MKRFVEFLSEETLEESARRSLSRINDHVQNREMGILSASRGMSERTPQENKAHTDALEHSIRSAGYGFFPVHGRYAEEHEGKQVPVKEKSFVVIGHKDGDSGLKDFLHQHASAHNQDSYIHKPHGSSEANIHAPIRDVDYLGLKQGGSKSIGEFHPNRVPEYSHTILTRGGNSKNGQTPAAHKTFAFDTKPKTTKGDPDFPSIK